MALDVASLNVKVSLAAPPPLGLGEVFDGDSDAFLDTWGRKYMNGHYLEQECKTLS